MKTASKNKKVYFSQLFFIVLGIVITCLAIVNSYFTSASNTHAQEPLPLIDPTFFDRKDILYSSEIGSWSMQDGRYDGHYMINYNNSCPNCPKLAKDAKIPVVRWAVWDTFPEQTNPSRRAGTMQRAQFDNVINGIRDTLGAYPFIKLQPIHKTSRNSFCPETWGFANLLTMNKNIIQQAGNKVQLYEISNEQELSCGYTANVAGIKMGQYWNQMAPQLKKYARSLGFEIYIGGPSFLTANINQGEDVIDLKKHSDFLQTIKNEYENPSSPYYHDSDLIPSFVSYHAYGIEYVNVVGGSSTPLDAIPHYAEFLDGLQARINNIWGPLAANIKIVNSEWNVGAETYTFPSPLSEQYYTQYLRMLRSKNVFMANQFLIASNNNKMDMITQTGQQTSYYLAFKYESLNDPLAIESRTGIPQPTPDPSDTTAPSVPTNLAATALGYTQINLNWTASTDNVAVVRYDVYRNNTYHSTTNTNSYVDTIVNPATTYTYYVVAKDPSNNLSSPSQISSATTAQIVNGTLTGRVTDVNGNGICSARISFSVGGVLQDNYTDCSTGNYTIPNIKPGTYTVTYSKLKYTSQTVTVIISDGGTITQNITLLKP